MLLSDGHIMYYGHALTAAHWLAACGHPLPFGVSVPDHLLDLACGDIPGVEPEHAAAAKQELLDKFRTRKIGGCPDLMRPCFVAGRRLPRLPVTASWGGRTGRRGWCWAGRGGPWNTSHRGRIEG